MSFDGQTRFLRIARRSCPVQRGDALREGQPALRGMAGRRARRDPRALDPRGHGDRVPARHASPRRGSARGQAHGAGCRGRPQEARAALDPRGLCPDLRPDGCSRRMDRSDRGRDRAEAHRAEPAGESAHPAELLRQLTLLHGPRRAGRRFDRLSQRQSGPGPGARDHSGTDGQQPCGGVRHSGRTSSVGAELPEERTRRRAGAVRLCASHPVRESLVSGNRGIRRERRKATIQLRGRGDHGTEGLSRGAPRGQPIQRRIPRHARSRAPQPALAHRDRRSAVEAAG